MKRSISPCCRWFSLVYWGRIHDRIVGVACKQSLAWPCQMKRRRVQCDRIQLWILWVWEGPWKKRTVMFSNKPLQMSFDRLSWSLVLPLLLMYTQPATNLECLVALTESTTCWMVEKKGVDADIYTFNMTKLTFGSVKNKHDHASQQQTI